MCSWYSKYSTVRWSRSLKRRSDDHLAADVDGRFARERTCSGGTASRAVLVERRQRPCVVRMPARGAPRPFAMLVGSMPYISGSPPWPTLSQSGVRGKTGAPRPHAVGEVRPSPTRSRRSPRRTRAVSRAADGRIAAAASRCVPHARLTPSSVPWRASREALHCSRAWRSLLQSRGGRVERRRQLLTHEPQPVGSPPRVVGGQRDAERIDAVAERARELLVEAAEEAGQRRVEARRPSRLLIVLETAKPTKLPSRSTTRHHVDPRVDDVLRPSCRPALEVRAVVAPVELASRRSTTPQPM